MLFSTLNSLLQSSITLNIPNLSKLFSDHLSLFITRSRLLSSSKIESKHLFCIFAFLLYIRLHPSSEKGRRFISIAKSFRFPRGFQNATKLIPLNGYFLSIRGIQIHLKLDQSYYDTILADFNEYELFSTISFLSKELSNGRSTLHEGFDEVGILSHTQNFMLDSFFVKETGQNVLHLNDLHPTMKFGTCFSFIYKTEVEQSSLNCLSRLFGCICSVTFEDSHMYVNERQAIEIIFHFKENKEEDLNIKSPNNNIENSSSTNLIRMKRKISNTFPFEKGKDSEGMSLSHIISVVLSVIQELKSNKNSEHKKSGFEGTLLPT